MRGSIRLAVARFLPAGHEALPARLRVQSWRLAVAGVASAVVVLESAVERRERAASVRACRPDTVRRLTAGAGNPVIAMQRSVGNAAVARALSAANAADTAPRYPAALAHDVHGGCRGGSSVVLQRQWVETKLNAEYYRWNVPLSGLRWYHHKHEDLMYFIAVAPGESARALLDKEGIALPRRVWLELGLVELQGADASVQPANPERPVDEGKDWVPFLMTPVAHEKEDERWRELAVVPRDDKFKKATGAASANVPERGKRGGLYTATSGAYVFHITTYRNLLTRPGMTDPMTGICARGLRADQGGLGGGASHTAPTQKLLEQSAEGSKGVVAVTVAPSTIRMYHGFRMEDIKKQLKAGTYTDYDVVEQEPVMLRFKVTQKHLDAMKPDPVHPREARTVSLIPMNIEPGELEALTADGWVSVMSKHLLEELAAAMPAAAGKRALIVHHDPTAK